MALLKSLLLGTAGVVAAFLLFDWVALSLSGSSWTWASHLALAALASLILAFSRRVRFAGTALASLAVTLLGLTAASALLFPALIRAAAIETSKGRPFCLVGPEVSANFESDWRNPYVLAPSLARSGTLTLLTLPRPLTVVIERPADDPEDGPGGKPDSVFMPFVWDSFALGFREEEYVHLREAGDSRLLDCEPITDPFTAPMSPDPVALAVWRDPMPASAGEAGWGPRQSALVRLPAESTPTHGGRFARARIGLTAALLPGAEPMPLTLDWTADPAAWLDGVRQGRVRDQDKPLDWSALPVNALGLVAYEVPSTSVAGAINGTYVLSGPDRALKTVIACDEYFCRHHSLFDPPIPAILSVTYPVALLPQWREIEKEARAHWADAITLGG